MGRRVPLREAAQGRGDQAGIGGGALEIDSTPAQQGLLGVGAGCGGRVQPQQAQRTVAVVREIGVDPHPAVGTGIQARELVPWVGAYAVDAEPAAAFERRMHQVDLHLLARRAAPMAKFAGGQRRSRDADLRGGGHGKGRRQHRFTPGQAGIRQRRVR